MTKIRKLFPRYLWSAIFLLFFASTSVLAQEFDTALRRTVDKWNNQPVINDSSLSILSSFAYEWNRLSILSFPEIKLEIQTDLSVFNNKTPEEVKILLNKLISGSDAEHWFNELNVQEIFKRIYSQAKKYKSPIAQMKPDDVLEYWIVSKVTTNENLVEDLKKEYLIDPQIQFCFWILWPCENQTLPQS